MDAERRSIGRSPAAVVSCPVVALAPYVVTTPKLLELVAEVEPAGCRRSHLERMIPTTGVDRRYWVRDPRTVLSTSDLVVDLRKTFDGLCELAERAAAQSLAECGLTADDVDCLITTSVSGYRMPGLDVYVMNKLRLRSDVRRLPVAQIGCAGGAYAIACATDQLRAYPGSVILIVCADAFSSGIQPGDTAFEAAIWAGLGGDGAAACVVREDSEPTAGFRVLDYRSHLLPDSADRYRLGLDRDGLHFWSTKAALDAVGEALPEAAAWLGWEQSPGLPRRLPTGWPLDFAIVHPGGPAILTEVARVLSLGDGALRHAHESLAACGNMTSASVLDVWRRHHRDPPADGACGVLVGLGPGFTTITAKLTWQSA
jgi:predicted naringenin-chalcone synthase